MSNRRFVSGSSVILAGWLGATFLNEVPAQRYPKLDKKSVTADITRDLEANRKSDAEIDPQLAVSAAH